MLRLNDAEPGPAVPVGAAPGPYNANSAAQFVAAMRALKEWSGFTYRQLQRRAEKAGGTLPHSTIAAVMSRSTLPREDLLRTFVQACGGDATVVAEWLAARKRIAAAAVDPSNGSGEPGTAGGTATADRAAPVSPVVPVASAVPVNPATPVDPTPTPEVGATRAQADAEPVDPLGPAPVGPSQVDGASGARAAQQGAAAPNPSPLDTTPGPARAAPAPVPAVRGPADATPGPLVAPPDEAGPASAPAPDRPDGGEAVPATDRIAVVDESWRQPDRPVGESPEPASPDSEPPSAESPSGTSAAGAREPATVDPSATGAPEAGPLEPGASGREARRPRHARVDGAEKAGLAKDYQAGSLASTARSQKKEQWVGVHRYDPAVEVPKPAGLRWLIPPIMYRTGWSSRVLAGVLVVVMAFIAVAVTARVIRGIGGEVPSTAQDPESGSIDEAPGEAGPEAPDPTGAATPSAAPSPTARNAAAGRAKPTPTAKAADNRAAAATAFSGRYRLRLAHTGMCVGEGPELYKTSGREVLGQHPCAEAAPPISLERVSGNVYRIQLHHPQYGLGCATIDAGGRYDGLLLAGDDCDGGREDQKYLVEPVSSPATGYRIRSVPGSAYCIGVYQGSTAPGVQLISTRCSGGKHEVFTFDRA
ncbi:hypothetical protein AB0J86_27645 [Micromonospora sp. NPDC049559]|uniref:hypothetical protein n=1 Tax=Micromonospora sp. NPDC049559 TaxID=3155923 RepID=UPI003417329B